MQCSTKTCAQQRTTAHNSAQLRCFENGNDDFGVEAFWIGGIISGNMNIAEHFNSFFTNIGPTLAECIPKSDRHVESFLGDRVTDSIFLNPVTDEELLNIVHNAKDKKSKGYDGIDMCMLKKIIPHILTPLRHICNTSLSQGIFPDEMKIARIIPLFKSGDKQNVSNYRPISLLPQFSKILEKIFNNRLMNFLNSNNLLYLRQYGFRKKYVYFHGNYGISREYHKCNG